MDKLTTALIVALVSVTLGAQTPPVQKPPTQAPPTQTTQTPPKPATPPVQAPAQTPKPAAPAATSQAAGRATATLFITNPAGQPVADTKVTLSGVADREVVTTRDGVARMANLKSGTYRARFNAPDFILFEKELVLRQGQPWEFEVTLNPSPMKKAEPQTAPPPAAAKKPVQPAAPAETAGEVAMLSLSDWLDRNLIGRTEPQKDSPIGQTAGAAATILQIRDNVEDRSHPDADEMLYVIAGDATVRIADRSQSLTAGWFVTIPRGTSFSLERRGRNPLIMLSILAPGRGAQPEPR